MRKALLLALMMISIVFLPFLSATATDTDMDGVVDSADICPFAFGNATSATGLGCPDSDGNGIADFEEASVYNWDDAIRESLDTNIPSGGVNGLVWATNNSGFYIADSGGGWGSGSGKVHYFDNKGVHKSLLYNASSSINEIVTSPDGTMLAIAGDSGLAVVINSTTGIVESYLGNTTADLEAIEWSNDGNRIYAYAGNNTITAYNTTTWLREMNITTPTVGGFNPLRGIDTTPDDRLLVFSVGRELLIYWSDNTTMYTNHTNHTESIRSLRISPDGRYVATGSNDNSVRIYDIKSKTFAGTISAGSDVYDLEFSNDGGTIAVARGRSGTLRMYDVNTLTETGSMDGFGSQNNNRGVHSIAFDDSGLKLAVGWRRGYVSLHMLPDAYIRIQGDFYTSLMHNSWKDSYYSPDNTVLVESNDRVSLTIDACDSSSKIGSFTNGVSPVYAQKNANYSENGVWDCKNTPEQILEIPYGRAAGALMVKAGGDTQTCIETIGGLSMAQVRWFTSSLNKNQLIVSGEMPGLNWDSVVPNDDRDNIPEWIDLDSSCPDTEIVLSHRWENKTDLTILEELVLCSNCANPDTIYPSSTYRYRAVAGEYRSDVTQGVAAAAGEGSIGFTELMYSVNNQVGTYIVPLVDNFTHGASDAIANGGLAINATKNNSVSGDWPLQTDMRAFISLSEINKNYDFLSYLLTENGQIKWDQMGFTRLSVYDLYRAWLKLGVDKSYLLPDEDSDGIWDGDDECPNSNLNFSINEFGCGDNQLDDDEDGYTNDVDDCLNSSGQSTFVLTGCPDQDNDGWPDSLDTHPSDPSEWNDTDSDGFGDNSDDCISVFGNSTMDLLGCLDTDGDGYSDANDVFPLDSTEWLDSDSDSYGDNKDKFPFEGTQWNDTDEDGFGDNELGLEGDNCVSDYGLSYEDGIFGCLDSDGDGWADQIDDLPSDPSQHRDEDGDGVGDDAVIGDYDWCPETPAEELSMVDSIGCSPSERDTDYDTFNDDIDKCLNTPFVQSGKIDTRRTIETENGTIENPYLGCAPSEVDQDNDGVSLEDDWDDTEATQWLDSDGDGFGDNPDGINGDECPTVAGTSFKDRIGCIDLDKDGWSNKHDFNDGDNTQWNDTDQDGFGDNWDNPEWNETRTIGTFVKGATQPDRCPEEFSAFIYEDTEGCLTAQQNNQDNGDDTASTSETGNSNIGLILGIAGAGIILILFGSIAVLMKKQSKPKKRKGKAPKQKESQPEISSSENTERETFVSTWEELPPGEWLPNDENGVNWYLDTNGNHWYSDNEGFRIWED